jgi:hypothetical protein
VRSYECWAWLIEDPDGPGLICAVVPGMFDGSLIPLQARRLETALRFEGLARGHAAGRGRPCRLAHLVEAEEP